MKLTKNKEYIITDNIDDRIYFNQLNIWNSATFIYVSVKLLLLTPITSDYSLKKVYDEIDR